MIAAHSNAFVLVSRLMQFGIRLLLVVALLLPIRSALAAVGALCHLGAGAPPAVAMTADPAQHDERAAGHADGHDHRTAHGEHDASDEGVQPNGSSCNFCSAVCGTPPLPAMGLGVLAASPAGAERFPALAPRCSRWAHSAPERPPRAV